MSAIYQLFYNADMPILEVACGIIAFVTVLEFVATVISSLSHMGR